MHGLWAALVADQLGSTPYEGLISCFLIENCKVNTVMFHVASLQSLSAARGPTIIGLLASAFRFDPRPLASSKDSSVAPVIVAAVRNDE